eukprot:scaffold1667_cov411-Prasinococcus_capsulatus_cf.AAC.8
MSVVRMARISAQLLGGLESLGRSAGWHSATPRTVLNNRYWCSFPHHRLPSRDATGNVWKALAPLCEQGHSALTSPRPVQHLKCQQPHSWVRPFRVARHSFSSTSPPEKAAYGNEATRKSSEQEEEDRWALAEKIAFPAGMAAGLLGSLVGVGGGVLIVPVIVNSCHVSQRIVSGTSLVAVVATGLVSTLNYSGTGHIDYPLAAAITLAACASAQWGARTTMTVDQALLRKTLGVFMCLAAPLVPLKSWLFSNATAHATYEVSDPSEGIGSSLMTLFQAGTTDPLTLSLATGVGYASQDRSTTS